MSESDTEQKVGRENLARMERNGWSFSQNDPQNPDAYTYVGVSSGGTPVWLLNEVASRRPEDHDRPGTGEPLGRGRRRQADPPGRRLGRDGRVEPLRVRDLAADALRRVRRPDALGHRRGRVDVRARLHDERAARHARPRDRRRLRLASRGASRGDPPLQRDLRVRVVRPRARPGGHRDLRRVRADRPPLLPHGLGLHVRRPRRQGRRHAHLREPLAGRLDRDRRLPGPRAHGPHEAVHAADAGELPARPAGHPRARDPDVGGVHLGADLRGDDAQAPDGRHARGEPRDGGRHRPRRDHLDRRGARRGARAPRPGREGRRAPVRPLPAAAERGADGPRRPRTCSRTPARRSHGRPRASHDSGAACFGCGGRDEVGREIRGSIAVVARTRRRRDTACSLGSRPSSDLSTWSRRRSCRSAAARSPLSA